MLMMAAAFILSLCSSSDAVIARSFASQLPAGAVMGFLLFGPMMDIKNMLMHPQVLIEILCQMSFGGMIIYLAASSAYLQYVTPRMRPYLYFTACIMGLWALAGAGRLFRPRHRIRLAHCFLLIIPVLIILLPHTPLDVSSYNTIGEGSKLKISKAERKVPDRIPDQTEGTADLPQETVPLEKPSSCRDSL